jgi:molybdate transport system substrate-binding protein
MWRRVAILIAGAFLVGTCATPNPTGSPQVDDLTVFAAASLTDAFTRAGDEFARSNARVRFTFNFGSSSTLATQITNGAPADIFAAADDGNMQKIVDAKLTDGAQAAFATNRLEIAVAPGNPKKIGGLADLARADVVLVLAAPTVPAGRYALEALSKAGVAAKPVSQEVDVRAVLNKVSLGEADAGIVYVTDVKSAGPRVTGVEIPEPQQVLSRYPIAVVKDSKRGQLAHRFVDYVLSPAGQNVLATYGFSKP